MARAARSPAFDRLLVGLLFLIGWAIAAQGVLIVDSGRDLANAWEIAHGRHWPLTGPSINGQTLLGPLWFYLLTLPFALGASSDVVLLLVAAASAMKFPLAYLVGRLWRDRATGLGFAAALALPGWASFESVVFSHTAITISAVLLTAGLGLHARRSAGRRHLLATGLAGALALHAHPTSLPVVAALLLHAAAGPHRRSWQARLAAMGWMTLGLALPWLPWLIAIARADGLPSPTFAAMTPTSASLPGDVLAVLRGLFDGIHYGRQFLLPAAPWAQMLALFALSVAALALLRGLPRWLQREPASLATLLLVLLIGAIFLAAIAPTTRVWMLFGLLPLPALLLGRTFGLVDALPRWRWLLPGFAVLALALSAAQWLQRSEDSRRGSIDMPDARIADVRAIGWDSRRNVWLPGMALGELSRALCRPSPPAASLHGDAAYLLLMAEQVPALSQCPHALPPRLGLGDGTALAGYPLDTLQALLPARSVQRHGGLGLLDVTVLHSAPLPARAEVAYLPERLPRPAHPGALHLSLDCPADGLLAIGNRLAEVNAPAIVEVFDGDGRILPPLAVTTASGFHACSAGQRRHLRLEAPALWPFEVLFLAAAEAPSTPPSPSDPP